MAKTVQIKKDQFLNSNIIQLLSSFTKDEKSEFGKYVHSPFNPRKEGVRFFAALQTYFH